MFMLFCLVILLLVVCLECKKPKRFLGIKTFCLTLFILAKKFKTKYPIREFLSKLFSHSVMESLNYVWRTLDNMGNMLYA